MTEIDYRWRKVADHGQPTRETCPHGYRWRVIRTDGTVAKTGLMKRVLTPQLTNDYQWQPLPPPCDEVAPPPEPEGRWETYCLGSVGGLLWHLRGVIEGSVTKDEARAAAEALNTLDRDGIVARPRPWHEAPADDTQVLRWNGHLWLAAMGYYVHRYKSPWVPQLPAPPEVES